MPPHFTSPCRPFSSASAAHVAPTDDRGRTPLHTAAELGLTNVITKLLNAQAPVAALDREGRSAFDLVLAGGHTPAARLLVQRLDWKPDPTARQTTPLHAAAKAGNLAVVQELVALTPTPDLTDELGQTPLVLAATHNHLAVVHALAERGANVNKTNSAGQTPVLLALLHRNCDQALSLLRRGADLNRGDTDGNTALHLSLRTAISDNTVSEWQTEFQRLARTNLVPAGTTFSAWLRATNTLAGLEQEIANRVPPEASFNRRFNEPWHEPWKFILAAGADVKVTNRLGQTALHILAAQAGFSDNVHTSRVEVAVVELVRRGLSPNARNTEGRTALHEAAQRGRWQIVQALLRHGADPNFRTPDGLTAGHLTLQAAWPYEGVAGIPQLLARHGADLNLKDTNGQTVIHHLSRFGQGEQEILDDRTRPMVREFLKAGADLNASDQNGDTPLHLAVRNRRAELANRLNGDGANPLLRNQAGESPLEMAAKLGGPYWPSVKLRPPNADSDVFNAAIGGDLNSLKTWLAIVPDSIHETNAQRHTPLSLAALYRRTNVVDFLLANGAKPDVFVAVRMGRAGLLEELLRQNRMAVYQLWHGLPLLHHAVAADSDAVLAVLLAQPAITAPAHLNASDSQGFTALHYAVTGGKPALAARLRAAGASESPFDLIGQNQRGALQARVATNPAVLLAERFGRTPLVFAIQQTNLAAVNVLLAAGADPNTPWVKRYLSPGDPAGTNVGRVLHAAVAMEQVETVRALLQHSAAVNVFERSGLTPLHLAAFRGHPELVKLLLDHGADPNARQEAIRPDPQAPPGFQRSGRTPLHLAVQGLQTNTLALLVQGGADLERTDQFGQTPWGFLLAETTPGQPHSTFGFGSSFPSLMAPELQRPLPPRRIAPDDVIRVLRTLGAKEPATTSPPSPPRTSPSR